MEGKSAHIGAMGGHVVEFDNRVWEKCVVANNTASESTDGVMFPQPDFGFGAKL